jgi:hypothetical protein
MGQQQKQLANPRKIVGEVEIGGLRLVSKRFVGHPWLKTRRKQKGPFTTTLMLVCSCFLQKVFNEIKRSKKKK